MANTNPNLNPNIRPTETDLDQVMENELKQSLNADRDPVGPVITRRELNADASPAEQRHREAQRVIDPKANPEAARQALRNMGIADKDMPQGMNAEPSKASREDAWKALNDMAPVPTSARPSAPPAGMSPAARHAPAPVNAEQHRRDNAVAQRTSSVMQGQTSLLSTTAQALKELDNPTEAIDLTVVEAQERIKSFLTNKETIAARVRSELDTIEGTTARQTKAIDDDIDARQRRIQQFRAEIERENLEIENAKQRRLEARQQADRLKTRVNTVFANKTTAYDRMIAAEQARIDSLRYQPSGAEESVASIDNYGVKAHEPDLVADVEAFEREFDQK